jgi:hypothetical protein
MFSNARHYLILAGVSCLLAVRAHATPPFAVELDGFASFSTISPYTDATTLFDPWVDPADSSVKLSSTQLSLDNYPLLGVQGQAQTFLRAYPGWKQGSPAIARSPTTRSPGTAAASTTSPSRRSTTSRSSTAS